MAAARGPALAPVLLAFLRLTCETVSTFQQGSQLIRRDEVPCAHAGGTGSVRACAGSSRVITAGSSLLPLRGSRAHQAWPPKPTPGAGQETSNVPLTQNRRRPRDAAPGLPPRAGAASMHTPGAAAEGRVGSGRAAQGHANRGRHVRARGAGMLRAHHTPAAVAPAPPIVTVSDRLEAQEGGGVLLPKGQTQNGAARRARRRPIPAARRCTAPASARLSPASAQGHALA